MTRISRRTLLATGSSALLSHSSLLSTSLMAADTIAAPSHKFGKVCLGLNGLNYFYGFYPVLNIWKQSDSLVIFDGPTSISSANPPGTKDSAWDGYLDENGELVAPLPPTVRGFNRVIFGSESDRRPDGYSRNGEEWIIKWDGEAGEVSVLIADDFKREGNRATWRWPNDPETIIVAFRRLNHANPPRNIIICKAEHEALIQAGEIFNPDWLKIVREGSGIIRFMGWQDNNNNRSTMRFKDIPGMKYFKYGGGAGIPGIKCGVPLELISKLVKQVGSHPWVCIPTAFGVSKFSPIQTIEKSNPAQVTSPGHNWTDGDTVIPYLSNWKDIERKRFIVSRSDPKAGTFALSGLDATNFEPFNAELAYFTAPYNLETIRKEVTPFAAHFRDTVKPPFVTYFELDNEMWNWLFAAPHWLAAQARGKFDDDNNFKMSGYLAAHYMNVIRETYGAENRKNWRGVLSTFVILADTTNQIIEGAQTYISENAPNLTLQDLFDDIAVTGYWGHGFTEEKKAETLALMAASTTRWKNGSEPTKYSHFDKVINEQCAESLEEVKNWWREQKKVAAKQNLGLIQYEGGNHNDPRFYWSLTPKELEEFMDFYRNCNHTKEDAKNYREMFHSFEEIGGQFPSKFQEMGTVSRFGAWGGLRHMKDENPVWDEVVAFNGRSKKS